VQPDSSKTVWNPATVARFQLELPETSTIAGLWCKWPNSGTS